MAFSGHSESLLPDGVTRVEESVVEGVVTGCNAGQQIIRIMKGFSH